MSTPTSSSPLKAAPLREAGQSLRDSAVDLLLGRFLPLLWLASLAWALAIQDWVEIRGWHPSLHAYVFLALAVSAACVVQFYFVQARVRNLQLGRDGERLVGEFLNQKLVPLGMSVVHDVVADGFNLDHVVVGPPGIFVIETKTRSKPKYRDARITFAPDGIRIAGHRPDRDPIEQVRRSSRWLSELLTESTGQSLIARGVVVFPGWFIEPMSRKWLNDGQPWVLEPKSLPSFLAQEPRLLDDREVKMFSNHLIKYVRARQNLDRKR